MKRISKKIILAALTLAPFAVSAVPIVIAREEWASDEAGWIGSDDGANVDNERVSQGSGELILTLEGPNVASIVRTSTGDSTGFTGDINPGAGYSDVNVTFDFITTGTHPATLGLYFASDNGGHWWSYSLNLSGVPLNGSYTYTVAVTPSWNPLNGAGIGTFEADFDAINWFGFYVENPGSGGTIGYHFDNLEFNYNMVPEPETVWMIIAVALSLGMTFRGRLAELAGQVKGRFVKA